MRRGASLPDRDDGDRPDDPPARCEAAGDRDGGAGFLAVDD